MVDGIPSSKLLENVIQLCVLQVRDLAYIDTNTSSQKEVNASLCQEWMDLRLLYNDLFEDPVHLPLDKGLYDHHIPLLEGFSLVNIRPYTYPLK